MSSYTTEDLQATLSEHGEIIVQLDSDGYPEGPELHLHDTTFHHTEGVIELELSDGVFEFTAEAVESIARHYQSTADLGM